MAENTMPVARLRLLVQGYELPAEACVRAMQLIASQRRFFTDAHIGNQIEGDMVPVRPWHGATARSSAWGAAEILIWEAWRRKEVRQIPTLRGRQQWQVIR
ncbi:hypothetical protein [Bordetella bronchiseptica]|uniref:hypothetical protein n=1 Tax=Bordetella bronchiseptica TaxID=518 RepID=UPI0012684888|nr:hypothetical protein [Bordetella bronchiseptica]